MLSHVLHGLERVGKIGITADYNRYVIVVEPGEIEQVGGQHDVNALLYGHSLCRLGAAQPDFQAWRLAQDIEELLLFPVALGTLGRILAYVVVIGAEKLAGTAELGGEAVEVKVIAVEVVLQGVIQVTSVYKDGESVFRNYPSLPVSEIVYT